MTRRRWRSVPPLPCVDPNIGLKPMDPMGLTSHVLKHVGHTIDNAEEGAESEMAVSSWGPRIAFWRETQKKPAPYIPLLFQMMDSSGKWLTRDSEENWANLDFYHHSAISSAEIYCLQCGYVRDCQVMSKNWGREEETPFAGVPPILGRSVARSRLGQPKTAGPRCRWVGAAITVDCVFEN